MASSRSFKSNRNSTNQTRQPTKIRWRQILFGFSLGIIASFALNYYIDDNPGLIASIALPELNDKQNSDNDNIDYEFFEILPNQTVQVDARVPSEPTHEYYLQAGSYQQRKDAETRRVELLLLSLSAKIETAVVNKVKVYRVITGPYPRKTLMSKARTQMITNGIEPLLLKRAITP